jgi:NTE family protein
MTRALVLGGGGVTGVAWATGLVVGLRDVGVDLTAADLVVGTSAGSVVGAQIATGTDLDERYRAQLEGPGSELPAVMSRRVQLTFGLAMLRSWGSPRAFRARVGAYALSVPTVPEQERVDIIGSRLPVQEWPDSPRLLVTAADAESGEKRVFSTADGVPLVRAVAASCAVPGVWPPVTIEGRRWIDGGVVSPANADLAAGADRVVIVAPIVVGIGILPGVAAQAQALRAAGAEVTVLSPDAASRNAIGANPLDPARRADAARAGHIQALTDAAALAEWKS